MDDLHDTLINRALTQAGHTPPPSQPSAAREDRWKRANQMISGYQNDWQPNPVLTNLLSKR